MRVSRRVISSLRRRTILTSEARSQPNSSKSSPSCSHNSRAWPTTPPTRHDGYRTGASNTPARPVRRPRWPHTPPGSPDPHPTFVSRLPSLSRIVYSSLDPQKGHRSQRTSRPSDLTGLRLRRSRIPQQGRHALRRAAPSDPTVISHESNRKPAPRRGVRRTRQDRTRRTLRRHQERLTGPQHC